MFLMRIRLYWLMGLLSFLLVSVSALADTSLQVSIRQVDANNFPFVFSSVTVDPSGVGVPPLTVSNFRAYEDGRLQSQYFDVVPPDVGAGVRLVDFVFLIDNSGSMSDKISGVRNNVNAFAESLSARGVDFRLGAVRLGQDAGGGMPQIFNNGNLTGDLATFHSWINQMYSSGGYEPGLLAVYQAATTFNFRPGSQRHFLLITDEESDQGDLTQAITACNANNIVVHVAVDCNYSYPEAYNHYCKPGTSISGATGGVVFQVLGPYDEILDQLVPVISNTYIVRYKTDNPAYDGAQRTVKIEVNAFGQTDFDIAFYTPGAGPRITRTQETIDLSSNPPVAGTPIEVSAHIVDDVPPGVASAAVYWKAIGDPASAYVKLPMSLSTETLYEATIPGSGVVYPGINYYITATDGQLTATSPSVEPGKNAYHIAVLPNHAPVILHTPVQTAALGRDAAISALVIDLTNYVQDVKLWYRKIGTLIYEHMNTSQSLGGLYTGYIPAAIVTEDGVEYFIQATDDLGVSAMHGPHLVRVNTLDLVVTDIKPVQVIFDANVNNDSRIDLVLGKSAVVLVYLDAEGSWALQHDVLLEVHFGDILMSKILTPDEFRNIAAEKPILNYVAFEFVPELAGDHEILVRIDPANEIMESDEQNNYLGASVSVKDTDDLALTFIPIDRPRGASGYGPIDMAEYSKAVQKSSMLIRATYPIAESELTVWQTPTMYDGHPAQNKYGMMRDCLSVWSWAWLGPGHFDRAIGIVPADYFAYHGYGGSDGIAFPHIEGVVASVDKWDAVAHEVGHTYKLPVSGSEEYGPDCKPIGSATTGFWVAKSKLIENSYCLMGCAMKDDPENPDNYELDFDLGKRWICKLCYESLFGDFRKNRSDPDVMLVSGVVWNDGRVELEPFYLLKNKVLHNIQPGEFSVVLTDYSGNVITETPFVVRFQINIDPIGVVNTDISGFALAVPYPDSTCTMQIRHGDRVLVQLTPSTKFLHDAIDGLPSRAFLLKSDEGGAIGLDLSENRRKTLHKKVDALEKILETGNITGAVEKLRNDIRDKLQKWLADDYEIDNPTQFSKQSIIALVNEIIRRLELQIGG